MPAHAGPVAGEAQAANTRTRHAGWDASGLICEYFEERADDLVVVGELRDMPPLLFMEEIHRRFPNLTIDGISSLDHEQLEHWQFRKVSPQGELIEQLVVDLRTDQCLRHFLKPGEPSSFSSYRGDP